MSGIFRKKSVVREIESLLKESKYEEVEKLVLTGLSKKKDPFLHRYFLGQAYEGQGKLELAISFYEKAMLQLSMSKNESMHNIQYKIADLCYKTGKIDQALSYYEIVLQTEPENHLALAHSAEIYYLKKKYVRCKQLLEFLLSHFPKDLKSRLLLAKVLFKLNQFSAGEHYLHSIIATDGVSDEMRLDAQEYLADSYFNAKNFIQSAEIYDSLLVEPLIMDNPDKALKVIKNLLMCLIIKRDLKAAQYTFENYLTSFDAQAKFEIMYTMAEGLLKIGEFYRSITMIKSIYERNKDFRDVAKTVERFNELLKYPNLRFIFTREYKECKRYITQVLKLEPRIQDILGNNYMILFDESRTFIINLSPFPLYANEAQECKNQIQMENALKHPIEYYSYTAMNQDVREVFLHQEVMEIFGAGFIDTFK